MLFSCDLSLGGDPVTPRGQNMEMSSVSKFTLTGVWICMYPIVLRPENLIDGDPAQSAQSYYMRGRAASLYWLQGSSSRPLGASYSSLILLYENENLSDSSTLGSF